MKKNSVCINNRTIKKAECSRTFKRRTIWNCSSASSSDVLECSDDELRPDGRKSTTSWSRASSQSSATSATTTSASPSRWWSLSRRKKIRDPKHFRVVGFGTFLPHWWSKNKAFLKIWLRNENITILKTKVQLFSKTVEVSVIVGNKFRRFKNEFPVASPFPFKQQQHLGWSFDVGRWRWQWQWHGGLFPKFEKQFSSSQICP